MRSRRRRGPAAASWRHARLVVYDISDDRRRQRIARFLKQRGIRLQKSVFLVRVHRHAMPAFLATLDTLRDPAAVADRIDVMPLCRSCRDRSFRLGQEIPVAIVVT